MRSDSDKPSTTLMLLNIGGATLLMAGVVFMIGSGELLPGLALCAAGAALLVVASQRKQKGAKPSEGT